MTLGTWTGIVENGKLKHGATPSGINGRGGNNGNGIGDAHVNSNVMMANDNILPHSICVMASNDGVPLLAHHSLGQP